jgi:hypothetical protein
MQWQYVLASSAHSFARRISSLRTSIRLCVLSHVAQVPHSPEDHHGNSSR